MNLQDMIDGANARMQQARASEALTLGGWIELLEGLPPDATVVGLGEPDSYRGYYSDLALEPDADRQALVAQLLQEARACMGAIFTGYKGGEFPMHAQTPMWVASFGATSEWRLAGLRAAGVQEGAKTFVPVIALDDEEYADPLTVPYVLAGDEA